MNDTELLDEAAAAELLGIRPQTLAVWRSTGRYELPFVKVGRCVRYKRTDLAEFLRSRTVTNTGEAEAL
jgi:excisionase family DNA binding protein